MSDQPTLWDAPTPIKRKRKRTADTQSDGRRSVQPYASTQRGLILRVLRSYGRLTRHEIAAIAGLPLSSVCGRVNELLASGEARIAREGGTLQRKDGRYVVESTFTTMRERAG